MIDRDQLTRFAMRRVVRVVFCIALIAGLVAALPGCDNGGATPDWSRMVAQPRLAPYGTTELFADRRAMRPLPVGTVPREHSVIVDGYGVMPSYASLLAGDDRYA